MIRRTRWEGCSGKPLWGVLAAGRGAGRLGDQHTGV